jgi:hypothetical protein
VLRNIIHKFLCSEPVRIEVPDPGSHEQRSSDANVVSRLLHSVCRSAARSAPPACRIVKHCPDCGPQLGANVHGGNKLFSTEPMSRQNAPPSRSVGSGSVLIDPPVMLRRSSLPRQNAGLLSEPSVGSTASAPCRRFRDLPRKPNNKTHAFNRRAFRQTNRAKL